MLLIKHETLSVLWATAVGWTVGFAFFILSKVLWTDIPIDPLKVGLTTIFSTLVYYILWFLFGREKLAVAVGYYPTPPNPQREAWQIQCLIEGGECLESDLLKVVLFQLLYKEAVDIEVDNGRKTAKISFLGLNQSLTSMESSILKNLKDFVRNFVKEEPKKGTYTVALKVDKATYDSISSFFENFPRKLVENFVGKIWDERGYKFFFIFALLIWSFTSLAIGIAFLHEELKELFILFKNANWSSELFLTALAKLFQKIFFIILAGFGFHFGFLIAPLIVVYLLFRTKERAFLTTLLHPAAILLGELILLGITFDEAPPFLRNYLPYLFLGSAITTSLLLSFPPHLLKKHNKEIYQELLLWLAFKNTLEESFKFSHEPKKEFLKRLVPYAVALKIDPERFESYKKASDFVDLLEKVKAEYSSRNRV